MPSHWTFSPTMRLHTKPLWVWQAPSPTHYILWIAGAANRRRGGCLCNVGASLYRAAMLVSLDGMSPLVDASAYIEDSAQIIGDVHIGAQSSVWFHTVVRGDVHHIRIGARTNIQDNSTIHVTGGRHATVIGDDVTVGHNVVLHGCTIADGALIGIGAIVLDRCEVGERSLVGAGSLLVPGTCVPSHSLVLGRPAKVVRALREEELARLAASAAAYVVNGERYRAQRAPAKS